VLPRTEAAVEWSAKVELFEQLRREYEFGVGTIRGVARKFGVHRRMVREAARQALPPLRKRPVRAQPRLDPLIPFIDAILEADRTAPRKQRHTARRIFLRLRAEQPAFPIAESTVRAYVRERQPALGLRSKVTCIPQSYAWGSEGQADWYEAVAELGGVRQTLQVFALRSMASGGAFHRAYTHATQQAFLEAHERAFAYFGGVFHRLRYDNLPLAVKRILRGREREQTSRFIAFRSHWRFASAFCTPGAGHEKGGIEGEAGYFRRNHWVPIPVAADLAALNGHLLAACQADQHRVIAGRSEPVGGLMAREQPHLLPLAAEGFDLAEVSFPTVDGLGRVRVRTNAYSVPLRPGTQVHARVYPTRVELWHAGAKVATHARCYGHQQEVLDLEHYLDVLTQKPGALAGATPLAQWRAQGRWPTCYDELWMRLQARQGPQAGTRAMIDLLQLGRVHGYGRLATCVTQALACGAADPAAVRYLLTAASRERPPAVPLEIAAPLAAYDRPQPSVAHYAQLLAPREGRP
jgi:transposase